MSSPQISKGRQKKTSTSYETEIRNLYNEIQLLEAYHLANPEDLETVKELQSKRETLKGKVKHWAERCNPVVQVANNEGLPLHSNEMPWGDTGRFVETREMFLKSKTGIKQVGDYVCFIEGPNVWYPRVVDRKTREDMYQTFVDEENRARFFREIATFREDPRFKDIPGAKLEIRVECTLYDFMAYIPEFPEVCKYCRNCQKKIEDSKPVYYCAPRGARVDPLGVCPYKPSFFDARKRTDVQIKALFRKKRTILADLKFAGVEVCWLGSRFEAAHSYPIDILEWLKGNYVSILKLDKQFPNDESTLLEKKAFLEASLHGVNASLERLQAERVGGQV